MIDVEGWNFFFSLIKKGVMLGTDYQMDCLVM